MPRYLHIPHTPDTARTTAGRGGSVHIPPFGLRSTENGARVAAVRKARLSPATGRKPPFSRDVLLIFRGERNKSTESFVSLHPQSRD